MKKQKTDNKNAPKPKNEVQNHKESPVNEESQVQEDEKAEVKSEKPIEDERSPEEKLVDELAEAKDKYLRLYSEFENYRRRTAKEKLEMMLTASERLLNSLLPVLDDFGRAEQSLDNEEDASTQEGMKLIASKFKKILESEGLKKMDTSSGTTFDSDLHDAITQIPAPKKKLKGKIVDTVENGYLLGEKVIRHAKVVIGS